MKEKITLTLDEHKAKNKKSVFFSLALTFGFTMCLFLGMFIEAGGLSSEPTPEKILIATILIISSALMLLCGIIADKVIETKPYISYAKKRVEAEEKKLELKEEYGEVLE